MMLRICKFSDRNTSREALVPDLHHTEKISNNTYILVLELNIRTS